MKSFCAGLAHNWRKSTSGYEIDSGVIQYGINRALEQKTTITSATVGAQTPGILQFERMPGIYALPPRRLRVRDLIPFRPTNSTGVDFVRRDTFTNAASPVAETVSKAESGLTFVIDSVNCRTIAHWIPAARQVLEDVAGLQAAIDFDLLAGLADVEDYELLRGSGAGQHLRYHHGRHGVCGHV